MKRIKHFFLILFTFGLVLSITAPAYSLVDKLQDAALAWKALKALSGIANDLKPRDRQDIIASWLKENKGITSVSFKDEIDYPEHTLLVITTNDRNQAVIFWIVRKSDKMCLCGILPSAAEKALKHDLTLTGDEKRIAFYKPIKRLMKIDLLPNMPITTSATLTAEQVMQFITKMHQKKTGRQLLFGELIKYQTYGARHSTETFSATDNDKTYAITLLYVHPTGDPSLKKVTKYHVIQSLEKFNKDSVAAFLKKHFGLELSADNPPSQPFKTSMFHSQ